VTSQVVKHDQRNTVDGNLKNLFTNFSDGEEDQAKVLTPKGFDNKEAFFEEDS